MQKLILLLTLSTSFLSHALIGGTPANSTNFPSSVIYIQNGCTAVLISPSKILLAAHCVLPYQNTWLHQKNTLIRFHRSSVAIESPTIEATISQVEIHPQWLRSIQSGKSMNQFISNKTTVDLAVLTIDRVSQKFSSKIFLPLNFNPPSIGDEVMIGGFGCETMGQMSRNPRYHFAWKSISKLNGNQFMTGSKDLKSKNISIACEGDSGGPVLTRVNGKFSINGINSYVKETSRGQFTTGHVQISLFKDWLLNSLKN